MTIENETTNGSASSEESDAALRAGTVRSIPTMRSCCGGMKLLIEQQGRAGFSLEIVAPESSRAFVTIRFASYEDRDAGQALDLLRRTSHEMSLKLAGWLSIRRCPYCGYSLRKMLAGTKKGFLRRLIDWIRASSND
ncbi:MAG TPA: hypothetical protein VN153_06330 [Tahibacter sp.]|nr:hypothetical protein [Tahibacter sp.]